MLCIWLFAPIWLTLTARCPLISCSLFTYFWEFLEYFPQVLLVAAIFLLAFYSTSCDFHEEGCCHNWVSVLPLATAPKACFFFWVTP